MSRLRRLNGGYMLELMTPPNKLWALLVTLALGLWAGGAAAQSDDDSGWFEGNGPGNERPTLKIRGKGQYDPPPADFQSDPPIVQDEAGADDTETTYEEEDAEDPASQQRAVSEFSPRLAPYGYWVDDPYYGRVWVPNRGVVGPDFRPYVSGGHWELTADDEWLWASDYPFGSITFHYGRWAWLSGGSWGWVPGYVYAPAWVDFRIGASGYVGWGPAPPYSVWRSGVFVSLGARRPVPYIFCPTSYVFSSSLPRYVVYDRHRVRSIAAQTHRYRPRYIAGSSLRVRSPSVREARIPNRYVPARRVIAEPRGAYVGSYRRESAARDNGGRYRGVSSRRDAAPRRELGSRRDVDSRRAPRAVDERSRYRSSPGTRPQDIQRPRGGAAAPGAGGGRGSGAPRWVDPPRNIDRSRLGAGDRRPNTPPRAAPANRGRDDAPRGRSYSSPGPQRRDASAGGGERRGSERRGGESRARSGSPSRGSSPSQQRSRDRDSRGSR